MGEKSTQILLASEGHTSQVNWFVISCLISYLPPRVLLTASGHHAAHMTAHMRAQNVRRCIEVKFLRNLNSKAESDKQFYFVIGDLYSEGCAVFHLTTISFLKHQDYTADISLGSHCVIYLGHMTLNLREGTKKVELKVNINKTKVINLIIYLYSIYNSLQCIVFRRTGRCYAPFC